MNETDTSGPAATEIEIDNSQLAVPVEDDPRQAEINQDSNSLGGNSVNMRLSAGGVEFAMDTRIDTRADLVEANAKLELALSMLAAAQSRLEAAFIRIGQLEAEVEQKTALINELQK